MSTLQRITAMRFSGNIIPVSWFLYIGKTNKQKVFKADLLAVNILSEVIYWYRMKETRDEQTGESTYEKKFKADKLQLSYGQIADKFGTSKRSVKRSTDLLVSLGAVTTEFRHFTVGNTKLGNVLFIEPIPDYIKSITSYKEKDKSIKATPLLPKNVGPSYDYSQDPITKNGKTNTEITNETTTEESFAITPRFKESRRRAITHKPKENLSIPEIEPLIKIIVSNGMKESAISSNLKMLMLNAVELHGIEFCDLALRGRYIQAARQQRPAALGRFFDPENGEWMTDCSKLATAPTVQAGTVVEPHMLELMAEFEQAQCQ